MTAAPAVIFDVTDAMSTARCDIFEDGFESGDMSAWSSFVPWEFALHWPFRWRHSTGLMVEGHCGPNSR